MTITVATGLVGDLILVRLLASGKKPPGPAKLRADLGRLFDQPPGAEEWQGFLDELVGAGLLVVRPNSLTDSGRAQALAFLGLESLPPRTNWKAMRNRYLVPKALGLAADGEVPKKVANAEGLGAYLLKTHYDLPAGAGASLARAINALVFKELGFPTETDFAGLKAAVLGRLLGIDDKLKMKDIQKLLPQHAVGPCRSGADGLREAILRRWIGNAEGAATDGRIPEASAFDLPAFAATVVAAARDCPTGRFGDNKVFINHVWRHLRNEPAFPPLDLKEFKIRLTEANHTSLLQLSRADLVQVMDAADVHESETPYLGTVFHFILIKRDRP